MTYLIVKEGVMGSDQLVKDNVMEKENFRYEIIKSMVKNTPNDSELGQKLRIFLKEEEQLDGDVDLEKYIKMVEGEIVMSGYNDGWLTKWFKEKLEKLRDKK